MRKGGSVSRHKTKVVFSCPNNNNNKYKREFKNKSTLKIKGLKEEIEITEWKLDIVTRNR